MMERAAPGSMMIRAIMGVAGMIAGPGMPRLDQKIGPRPSLRSGFTGEVFPAELLTMSGFGSARAHQPYIGSNILASCFSNRGVRNA